MAARKKVAKKKVAKKAPARKKRTVRKASGAAAGRTEKVNAQTVKLIKATASDVHREIIKEIRLGLQDCGRKVATFIRKRRRETDEAKKRAYIEKYIPQVAVGLQEILGFSDRERDKVVTNLTDVLEKSRKL